jgi:alcohol dehydrogenase class IV
MRRKTGLIPAAPILAVLALSACGTPPPMPPPGPTLTLGDAMAQAVEALAATRAQAAGQGLRACGAEAVFQVMPVAAPRGVQLVLAPADSQEGPHSSSVTLTLAGENCDAPEPPPRPRR